MLATWGYVTCKFLTRVEIHPGLNSTLPMVKALFVVACGRQLKIQSYGYFNPVLITGLNLNFVIIRHVFAINYVKLRRNHSVEVKRIKCKHEKNT